MGGFETASLRVRMSRAWRSVLSILISLFCTAVLNAQVSPEEHAKPHPLASSLLNFSPFFRREFRYGHERRIQLFLLRRAHALHHLAHS